jgi:hypothetical protein
MGLGFELAESMTGTYHLFRDPLADRVLRVTLRLAVDGLRRFARHRTLRADGAIVAEGLAENGGAGRSITGAVLWKLFDEKRVPYALSFKGDDERTYHLRGQRDFFAHDAAYSLTSMAASLYDERELEIGRATLRFEPRVELPALLKTFRPRLRLRGRAAQDARSSRLEE